ncbi:MAG TPA: glycosyltransferase [Casimicrobiaceae bacterium]|jgi:glycosyltransferase involved in cell wall biosynthesis|nr:glycosyltransferase [Casimicrobiaceae bacterium]
MSELEPRVVVLTTLFPHAGQPTTGLFIRERMFRVARLLPLTVVAPVPWFPFQALLRRWKPHFRPPAPAVDMQEGIEVQRPRFLSVPGAFKWLDGWFMAVSCLPTLLRLKRGFGCNVVDAHFSYPEGYAATLLGRWLHMPVSITMRGTEVPIARDPRRRRRMIKALQRATRIFAVSDSLKRHAVSLGVAGDKILVVGNGVDTAKYHRLERRAARQRLGLPLDAPVLVSVGALVERKGFHRVLECLPALRRRFPGLRYLMVGGAGPEGDWSARLRKSVSDLGLQDCVVFLGALAPEELNVPLSAADLFVLATRNEGWANVFLEAMACGLPVVTTDVGGNAEVVANANLGMLVPFGDPDRLAQAIADALVRDWDRDAIVAYAESNSWERCVRTLAGEFAAIAVRHAATDAHRRSSPGKPLLRS